MPDKRNHLTSLEVAHVTVVSEYLVAKCPCGWKSRHAGTREKLDDQIARHVGRCAWVHGSVVRDQRARYQAALA